MDVPAVSMRFPANPPVELPRDEPVPDGVTRIVQALLGSSSSLRSQTIAYDSKTQKLVVLLEDGLEWGRLAEICPDPEAALAAEQDEFDRLPEEHPLHQRRIRGVSLVVDRPRSAPEAVDFASRYFSPWNGIPEDPVNGSSHTVLGPFFASLRRKEESMDNEHGSGGEGAVYRLRAAMASRRQGVLALQVHCRSDADGGGFSHIMLGGPAVLISDGTVHLPEEI